VPKPIPAHGCQRSTHNYPRLVADRLPGRVTLVDRSCGGATTDALTGEQRPGIAAQLDAVDDRGDLVTVGIGAANGRLFPILVEGCPTLRAQDPTGSPCRSAMQREGRDELQHRIAATAAELDDVLARIQREAPRARILVVGYPAIFPLRDTCPDRFPLADGDVAYAARLVQRVNAVVAAAAERAGVGFVDAEAATRGHDICAADPWIQGSSNERPGAMAYHPRADGQRAVAKLVLAAVS
jgi:hypothetical protein